MYNIQDYNYELPKDLIAQVPVRYRDRSRLLLVERAKSAFSDYHFFDLPRLLTPGDLLVVNNTKVVPARLFGRKESGGHVELLVLEHPESGAPESNTRWCLVKSSNRPKKKGRLLFDNDFFGTVEDLGDHGLAQITFQGPRPMDSLLEARGSMPLPPYISRNRNDYRSALDRERYQTVFARESGAVAAPTAGLHFTEELIRTLEQGGFFFAEVTLHVGHGTFRPVRTRDIRHHNLGEEHYIIGPDTAEAINRAKKEGRRVIAVGTTVVRVLETTGGPGAEIVPGKGTTDLFITPGHQFSVVDCLITNFHLPRSSLLFLVAAFAGLELIKEVYRWAMEERYRFYSYGDAMLII